MTVGSTSVAVQLTVRGDIPEDDRVYALSKIRRVLPLAHQPVLKAHLVLGWASDPGHSHPARLEIGLDLNGVPVRAHVSADSVREGADLLQERLSRRLTQLQDRSSGRQRGVAANRELAEPRAEARRHPPVARDRGSEPAEPSEIVRRKTFAADSLTADEAVEQMDLLDHDFYLYTDQETGSEAVAYRSSDPAEGQRVLLTPAGLTEGQAQERLDVGGEPFVFFRDPDGGRGCILYRRFDGRYGVITPV